MSERKRSYYGPFFWIAMISFIVLFVVAGKSFHDLILVS